MKVTASTLRQNIYSILDHALASGEPVEIIRKGPKLRIVPEQKPSKLSRLKKRSSGISDAGMEEKKCACRKRKFYFRP